MWKLFIVFGCLLPAHQVSAAFLQECQGVIINKVTNPNQACSEFVHCNGDDSYYCNGDCWEPIDCYGAMEETSAENKIPSSSAPVAPQDPMLAERSTPTIFTPSPSYPPSSSATIAAGTTISSSSVHVICKTSGRNGVYPYPANSNYYYQCISGYLLLQQCPQNFHFEAVQERCTATKPYLMIRLFV
ncbi:uncharacterized protein LOC117895127 [Drosophila subobscura]|uniref:uncharacterized protein LOC117895127 n=1 Tax=Drosophila subobscura TaxID=7241 RepID=UPI00155B31F5|nr:uncharacterized protein LOC117895127 [Drosophila subobscura]